MSDELKVIPQDRYIKPMSDKPSDVRDIVFKISLKCSTCPEDDDCRVCFIFDEAVEALNSHYDKKVMDAVDDIGVFGVGTFGEGQRDFRDGFNLCVKLIKLKLKEVFNAK